MVKSNVLQHGVAIEEEGGGSSGGGLAAEENDAELASNAQKGCKLKECLGKEGCRGV